MKYSYAAAVALFLILCGSLNADIRKFDQRTLEKLGVAIYQQDIRAAEATDILFAKKIDPEKEGLRGWIVEGDEKKMLIRFVREREGHLEAFYDVIFDGKKKPVIAQPKDSCQGSLQNQPLVVTSKPATLRVDWS